MSNRPRCIIGSLRKKCARLSSSSTPRDRSQVHDKASNRERFLRLAAEWKDQSRYLSNSARMALPRPYQRIIGMGLPVVPLILEELQRELDQWF